jgi:hypothetical protein
MGASWHHTRRGRLEHIDELRFVVLAMASGPSKPDAFAGQCAGYEGCLPFPDYPFSVMR